MNFALERARGKSANLLDNRYPDIVVNDFLGGDVAGRLLDFAQSRADDVRQAKSSMKATSVVDKPQPL